MIKHSAYFTRKLVFTMIFPLDLKCFFLKNYSTLDWLQSFLKILLIDCSYSVMIIKILCFLLNSVVKFVDHGILPYLISLVHILDSYLPLLYNLLVRWLLFLMSK